MIRYILRFTIIFFIAAFIFLAYEVYVNKVQANIDISGVFVASTENIANQNNSNEGPIVPGAKTFSEFSESTIDKQGFYLRIDKINLFKRIVKNVDPRYKEEYVKSWAAGISHGKFTSTPDQIGITYLFAHATGVKTIALEQNAWFSNLDNLVTGDTVIVYYQGFKYTYIVSEILVVSPSATAYYTGASPVAKLRMQYCAPPTGSLASRTLVDSLLVEKAAII
jgi:sortase (surface protein transpeptidase)